MDARDAYKIIKPALRVLAFWGIVLMVLGLEHSRENELMIGSVLLSIGTFGWE